MSSTIRFVWLLKRTADDEGSERRESRKRNRRDGGGGEKGEERERSDDQKEESAIDIRGPPSKRHGDFPRVFEHRKAVEEGRK